MFVFAERFDGFLHFFLTFAVDCVADACLFFSPFARPVVLGWVLSMGVVRHYVAAVAAHCNYFASRRTSYKHIQAVIELLRSMDTGRPLIRLGGAGDGGYLIPDDLQGIRACFSPGVAAQATFEKELQHRGIGSYLADYSVLGPPPDCASMSFEKKFLGAYDSDIFTTLASWVGRHPETAEGDLLLQMDVEGAEYEIIANIDPVLLRRFRILVIEFHDFECLAQPFGYRRIFEALTKLSHDFVPVHLHPNNYAGIAHIGPLRVPRMLEISYLRRDRCSTLTPRQNFPHPEDRDNVPDKPSAPLPRQWFS